MDAVKVKAEEWRSRMDRLASEKETARAQLTSAQTQLRETREKAEAQSQNIEELRSQLSSVASDQETLAKELKAANSVVEVTKADDDEMVAQYKVDVESAEVECAKGLEAESKKLMYPEEEKDSEGSGGSGSGENSDGPGDEAGSGGDQAI
nr:S-antigen protein-like [Nicotiana tomentosiformis]